MNYSRCGERIAGTEISMSLACSGPSSIHCVRFCFVFSFGASTV
jgi:hypothetical protein